MIAWLSPGDPSQRTGGYLWNARIATALRARGREVVFTDAPPEGAHVVADGLVWPSVARPDLARRAIVVVHSLASHEGGDDTAERRSWDGVRGLVVTSAQTARELGRPSTLILPGTTPARRARGGDGRTLLSVATLTPRKRHDRLLHALRGVDARLRCAGAARDPAWARHLRSLAVELGVDDRVEWLGDLDDDAISAALDGADLVVQAAGYEAFGMAVAEAVARGLPVLTTPAGVVEHLPPGAVQVVEPDALPAALAALLSDDARRRALAERAFAAAPSLPDWPAQAALLDQLLTSL